MKINVISESQWFPVLWGGTHTAFLNSIDALKTQDVTIAINSLGTADITHIHTFGLFSLYKLLTSKHTVVTSHMMPETLVGTFKGDKYWFRILTAYLRFFYNHADLIIALNQKTQTKLRELGVNKKMVIVHNAINVDMFKPNSALRDKGRKELHLQRNDFVVLGVGHFIPRKGIKDFVHLAEQLPNFTFLWVGGKPVGILNATSKQEHGEIHDLPSNIIIIENVSYDTMPLYFNMSDVFLSLSYHEVSPMSILEAAASGLPVILRDLQQYKTMYHDDYLVGEDIYEFKNALQTLYSNKNVYKEFVAKSKNLADSFSSHKIGSEMLKQYQNLFKLSL